MQQLKALVLQSELGTMVTIIREPVKVAAVDNKVIVELRKTR